MNHRPTDCSSKPDPFHHRNKCSTSASTAPRAGADADYVLGFERSLRKWLKAAMRKEDFRDLQHLDDVVNNEVVRLLSRQEWVPECYPDPDTYGYLRAVNRRAFLDWHRNQNVQAGRGVAGNRSVLCGEQKDKDKAEDGFRTRRYDRWMAFDIAVHVAAESEAADQREVEYRDAMLEAALAAASPKDRELLEIVYLTSQSQAQIAAEVGVARETLNRQLRKAVQRTQSALAAQGEFVSAV